MADPDDLAPVAASTSPATKKTGFILVVRHAFADYGIGDEITDSESIKAILNGEQAVYVIKRATA